MLLVVDIGNSHTAVGVVEGERVTRSWRISTVAERTADEYRLLLQGLLNDGAVRPEGAAISSVVPPATTAVRRAADQIVDGPVVVVGPGVKTGLPIRTDNPREVGADRVVNSVGAIHRYGTPVVVVDFGTATTIDVVDQAGEYVGGVIAPGLEVSMGALVQATAALRRVELEPPPSPVGRNTVEAIQSGLLYGHAGLIDRLIELVAGELGSTPAAVATGGLAEVMIPLCRTSLVLDEFLTLDGLRLIYHRNR